MTKAKIFIVEDEAIIAMELESSLQSLGYEVTSIVDMGEKAIEKAEKDKPDLILMDIRIKGEMDGIETAEIIRNKFGIPIIFSTAYLDQERIERAKITMPFGYVLKPIQERDLKVTIEMALYVSKVDAERRKSEEDLREKSKQNQILLDAFPCIALLLKPSTREIVASNRAAIEVGAIPGEKCYETWGQSDSPCPWCLAPNLWKTGEAQHCEAFGVGAYWDARWIPVSEDLYMHYAFDITERKQAEEALRKSELMFKKAEAIAHVGTWTLDPKTMEVEWSDELYRIFGLSPEDISGSLLEISMNVIHPDDREIAASVSQSSITAKNPYQVEYRVVHPDGSIRHTITKGDVVCDENDEVKEVVGKVLDITDLKQAEDRNQKSEANLRTLIENVDISIWSVDLDYRLMESNSIFRDQLKQAIGKESSRGDDLLLGQPEDLKKEWQEYYDRALNGESFIINTQTRFTSKPINIQYRFNPIRIENQQIIGATVFRHDFAVDEQ